MSDGAEVRCAVCCTEDVPEIFSGDWKGPPADSSEVVRWHYQLVGGG